MTTEKVNDLELVKLSDYFTPGKFRTIPGTAMTDRGGITEMQAVFNINTDFAKRLTFQFSTMLVIYGFGILNDKLIEINNHSFSFRKGSSPICRKFIRLCKKHDVRICVSSDAHICLRIGIFDDAILALQEENFPEELIVSRNLSSFREYLSERKNRIEQ